MKERAMTRVKKEFISITDWIAEPEDIIFNHMQNYILAPVSRFYNVNDERIDYFSVQPKRAYNEIKIRSQCIHYLNYFEKFYDPEKELLAVFCRMKYFIDCEKDSYNKDAFFYDLDKYIFHGMIFYKIRQMNRDNYCLSLKFDGKDLSLYYNNNHVYTLLLISAIMNLIIPLLTHFASVHKIRIIDDFLYEIYLKIFNLFSDQMDLYNKLYESCITNIQKNSTKNALWEKQDIRGLNMTTHAIETVKTIMTNIMPKYVYDANPVNNGGVL